MFMFIFTSIVIGICMIPVAIIIGLMIGMEDFRYNSNFPFIENVLQLIKVSYTSLWQTTIYMYGVGLIIFFILLSLKFITILN